MMGVVAGALLIAGSLFTMLGGIGVLRFPDVMARMHAAAKAPTLGLILVAVGAAIEIGTAHAIGTLVLVVILQLLTSPVATHMLGRASHGQVEITLDGGDALAEHLRESAEGGAAGTDRP
ncbi:MAG: monovalent cation/H(+) antiporter subunit G [Ilumatobacter sp.]|nr:monovalent cation/H(+) antiporter subunit G [Ilumatobacter sp.]